MAFPDNNLRQTAVYWGNPTPDGFGGWTYDDPIEISCRWENAQELIRSDNGEQIMSKAKVQVSQDLDHNGKLFLGDLDDLDSDQEADPKSVTNAYDVKRFDKVPTMNSGKFYRRAWL